MEFALTPYTATPLPEATSVLAIAPHPDDEVFGCGGTLALYAQHHVNVHALILTSGDAQGHVSSRHRESEHAAKVLGLAAPTHWHVADRGVYADGPMVERLVALLRSRHVDLLLAPSPWEVHPDHRQACRLALLAARACDHRVRLMYYEVGQPLRANALIDITAVAGLKLQAMRCFTSQLHHQDYDLQIAGLNRYRTYTLGQSVKAVEAFHLLEALPPDSEPVGFPASLTCHAQPWNSAPTASAPQVSVLIRSANRPYLQQALDSLALQTHPSIQVLVQAVLPDHAAVPARCGPHPVTLLPTDRRLSRSEAANALLEAAEGPWLIFLDDDDWFMPHHVARLAQVLGAQTLSKAAYTGVALVNDLNQPTGAIFDLPVDPGRWPAGNLTPIHGVMFHRSLLDAGCRFDPHLDRYEDWDFWLQLNRLTVFMHLPGTSAAYRIHNSSGVHEDTGAGSDASAVIHDKWSSMWTSDQKRALMERAWGYADLEHKLLDAQRSFDELMTLRRQERELFDQHLSEAHALIQRQATDMEAIKASSSWKMTAPIREMTLRLRKTPFRRLFGRLRRVAQIVRDEGIRSLWYRVRRSRDWRPSSSIGYTEWAEQFGRASPEQLQAQRQAAESNASPCRLSVVMPVYNPPIALLQEAIASVQAQSYPHWELCIADDASSHAEVWPALVEWAQADPRIKITRRAINGHISHASNSALGLASGDFVVLMDNDDLLPPDALHWVADAVRLHPEAAILYSDEDKLGPDGARFGPYMKTAWNHTLFLGHNMISHLGVYRRALVEQVGGFRPGFEGSQDYDLALRCVRQIKPHQIVHIPRILYHWRAMPGSTALDVGEKPYALTSAQRALQEHLNAVMPGARIDITPSWNYRLVPPSVDPTVDLTVVVISARLGVAKQARHRHHLSSVRCRQLLWAPPETAAAQQCLQNCQTPLVALIREDLEPIDLTALDELCAHAMRPGVAAAAGSIFDPRGRLVDGGWGMAPGASAPHVLHQGLPLHNPGYMGRAQLAQEVSAFGLSCVVIKRDRLLADHALHGDRVTSPATALDWCQRARSTGDALVWVPSARWKTQAWGNSPAKTQASPPPADPQCAVADPAYHPCLQTAPADFQLAPHPGDQAPRLGLSAQVTPPDAAATHNPT